MSYFTEEFDKAMQYVIDMNLKQLFQHAVWVAYRYGWTVGEFEDDMKLKSLPDGGGSVGNGLLYEWYFKHGNLRIMFEIEEGFLIVNRRGLYGTGIEYRFGKEETRTLCARPHVMIETVQKAQGIINTVLGGIKPKNTIGYCQSGMHQFHDDDYPAILDYLINNKWICEDCLSHFVLSPPQPVAQPDKNTPQQIERAKLTAGMRFQVLERDSFQCRSCGASPRDDNSIKLHVDHIHPIAHGGKTELDNLQTLCAKCNLGKSDKIVEQMKLWGDQAS